MTFRSPLFSARQFCRRLLDRNIKEVDVRDLEKSAIVFAPHQDDETLGCGGTILRKKQARADLKIVFMTDGSQSHGHILTLAEVKSMRSREAIDAAKILGIEADNLFFLEFPDGSLSEYQNKALEKVVSLLQTHRPQEIFVPYYRDGVADHVATNQIVLAALAKLNYKVTIYEYPIWFWSHWPWTNYNINPSLTARIKHLLKTPRSSIALLRDFKDYIDIQGFLALKRTALLKHQSQTKKLIPNSNWLTLNDVSGGEFVECFFYKYELFRRYDIF